MVDIVKPDISSVWAEAGAVITPSNEKIKLGWTSEVPPHQYENFVQNRQDEMLAYLNQKGVPEWRTGTEYFLGKSFVQDDGKIYKANKNSGGLLPNQKPSTDATNEYWEQATFSLSDLKQAVGTSTKDVMSQKATSDAIALKVDSARVKQVTGVSTTDIMSQKAVTDALGTILPTPVVQSSGSSTTDVMSQKAVTDALSTTLDDAFGGGNQSLSTNGYQVLPGGLIIQWVGTGLISGVAPSSAVSRTVTFPIAFPNQGLVYWASISSQDSLNASGITTGCYNLTTTQMSVAATNLGSTSKNLSNILCFAIGY